MTERRRIATTRRRCSILSPLSPLEPQRTRLPERELGLLLRRALQLLATIDDGRRLAEGGDDQLDPGLLHCLNHLQA